MSHGGIDITPSEAIDVILGDPPIPGAGGGTVGPAAVTNLSQRMQFRAYPFQRNGVTYTGWVSVEQTVGLNERLSTKGFGFSKHIRAQLVYNRGRGTMQMAILTDGLQSVGGFFNGNGRTRAVLPVVVRGTVVMFSTGTSCPFE